MMVYHLVLVLGYGLMQLVVQCARGQEFLYYASEARDGTHAGLWGGYVDPNNGGKSQDLKTSGFHCADMKNGYYTGLRVKGMSHDPVSKSVIMELDEWSETTVTALKVPVCTDGPSCATNGDATVYFTRAELQDKPQASKLGPFAIWNNTVYFIAQIFSEGETPKSRIHRMEIRKLEGCEKKYPFTRYNYFNIEKCSQFVALVVQETANDVIFQMRETVKPSDHLHVVQSGEDLVFLVQLYNYTMAEDESLAEFSMNLVSVTGYSDSPPTRLHHAVIDEEFTYHVINQVGDISYKDGVLCWTSMDRISCALWDARGGLQKVKTILHSGQASQICTGTEEEKIFANVTTGVTIANTQNGLTIYFGCYVQESKVGGAALLKTSSDWSLKFLQGLSDKHGKIYAGSMFLTEACTHLYPQEDAKDTPPVPLEDTTKITPVAEKATSDNAAASSRAGFWWTLVTFYGIVTMYC